VNVTSSNQQSIITTRGPVLMQILQTVRIEQVSGNATNVGLQWAAVLKQVL
jgi:hypothetical protein